MNVGDSIRKAIDDWEMGDADSAMMHACNAIDGTAKKVYRDEPGNNARFTRLLRENYAILGPMGMPGVDLVRTRFPVMVERPKASGGIPDIADIVYGIHRCAHGHGEALPDGFALLADAADPNRVARMTVEKGAVRLSDRMIFGLAAVAVLSPTNVDQKVPEGYHLTLGGQRMYINEWWGRATDFLVIAATDPTPLVTMAFGDWLDVAK